MNLAKILCILFIHSLLGYFIQGKCINVIRVPSMDNRKVHTSNTLNKDNITECLKTCSENGGCLSLMFNAVHNQCVILMESFIPLNMTTEESGWIFLRKQCDYSWTFHQGFCFKLDHSFRTWNDAKEKCSREGAWLAEVYDIETVEFIHRISNSELWLGGTDTAKEGQWIWDHSNTSVLFGNWFVNEPSGYWLENCMASKYTEWHDYYCSSYFQFVCEKHL